MSHSGAMFSY